MKHRPHSYLTTLVITMACVLLSTAAAHAFKIHGSVTNGTTGTALPGLVVKIVNPSGGMMVEHEVTSTSNGEFEAADLGDDNPIYLTRVTYNGVNYTEIVRNDGSGDKHIDIKVYETTRSWDHVHVSIPHMMLSRGTDSLTVEKIYQISNDTSPPRTVYGEEARFTFYIPPDLLELNSFAVMSMGIPLPLTPLPTNEPGFYTVDYPIRPAITQVRVSFDLPYSDGRYAYEEKLKYDLEEMILLTGDPGIQIASDLESFETLDSQHGFAAYRLASLPRETTLSFRVSGGSASAPSVAPRVLIIPNETESVSIIMMVVLMSALTVLLAFTVGRGRDSRAEEKVLEQRKEELLSQLAKLDDFQKTGTIADELYRRKRSELTDALAQIYYRLRFDASGSEETKEKEGVARV